MEKKYKIVERKREVKVRELVIEFVEKIKINLETNENEYDRQIELENTNNLYNKYREIKKMNMIEDIIKIREKYHLNQSDYSLILGLGKVTIHRYENGMLQTEANDTIITLSKNPKNMKEMLIKNMDKVSEETYNKLLSKLIELEELEKHKILDVSNIKISKNFETAEKLLYLADKKENNLTPLALQKLLYYIQGICLCIYEKPAFPEEIYNWEYGPVIKEIYYKYRKYKNKIIICKNDTEISEGLENIIYNVLMSYGNYTGNKLIELTHEEEPWKKTEKNEIIKKDIILSYFKKLYV